ncbi:MAG: chloride channel protein [Verrucomicrobiota bacterium]
MAGAIGAGIGALVFSLIEKSADTPLLYIHENYPWIPPLVIPAMLLLILWLRDKYFLGTDGTGIPQTIAALKLGPGEERDRLLSLKVAGGKILLTSMGLLSFLSIGREGPSVQLGACCMHTLSRLRGVPQHLADRGLILAGGAAGIAAAFNAPVAGIVFAMEEIGRSFDKRNMAVIVRTVVIACVICVIGVGNDYFYGRLQEGTNPLLLAGWKPWIAVLLIGLVGGALGGLFSKLLLILMPFVSRMIKKRKVVTALVIGAMIAVIGIVSDGQSYGSGYAQARALLLEGSPAYFDTLSEEAQSELLKIREGITPLYPAYRASASFLVLLTAIPGGLFDPSFSIGAGLGLATHSLFAWTGLELQAIVLLFMAAYFAGVVQSPMTSFIILLEMTGVLLFSLPLAGAAITAYAVSKLICKNALYEALAENFIQRKKL